MAFTFKDRKELERLRRATTELDAKEREAVEHLVNVLYAAGLRLDPEHSGTWATVYTHHADAIRDALEPFDSGVRCKDEAA